MAVRNRGPDLAIDEQDDIPGIFRRHGRSTDRRASRFNDTSDTRSEFVHGESAVSILCP